MELSAKKSPNPSSRLAPFMTWGMAWLVLASIGAGVFFLDGLDALFEAWQLPEYSHGPLIPVLSGLLFLRQLKEFPVDTGPKSDRWVGFTVILAAIMLGSLGRLSNINDLVAYAIILWVGGILLVSFGWKTGKHFWPGVLHLVYMLPLPGVLYYKMTTWLQFVSSELGVWFLGLLSVPVFLDGNIIDLGVTKLHVAEACSGLRYLFPILSFSYVFAALYKGPIWHKAVLLISAAPITVIMNSVRIAVAGYIVNHWGLEWVEGFSHFFEGWVIFLICIILLFLLARFMLFLNPQKMSLVDALDLDTDGLATQAARIKYTLPSSALIATTVAMFVAASTFLALPERGATTIERESFVLFPRTLGEWSQRGTRTLLSPAVEESLGADDYHQISLEHADGGPEVGLFMAWYQDQSNGGVHSPEICLPGAGWEIAWLERTDISSEFDYIDQFEVNRALIQKGETRMMVYYWFEQKGRRVAWDFAAKVYLMIDGVKTGRTDGGLVRLTTLIGADETADVAEARLQQVLRETMPALDRFMPED